MKSCPACKSTFPGAPPRCPLDGTALVDAGPDLLAGRVIHARYRFVDRLGGGSTAEVYKAFDTQRGAQVAVRVLLAPLARDAFHHARFLEQARAFRMAAPHEALVDLFDVVQPGPDGRPLMVCEMMEVSALSQVLAANALPVPVALDVARCLALLLEHLHAHDVLARDLTANAIFLAGTNPVALRLSVDALAPGPTCAPDPVPPLQAPMPYLAAVYAPPERVQGEPGQPAGDVYSLGALLFEMVTGQPLFRGSVPGILQQHLNDAPPVLRRIDPAMPGPLEELLARMLAKVPRFRPAAAVVARELAAIRALLLA